MQCTKGKEPSCVEKYSGEVLYCNNRNLTNLANIEVPHNVTDLILDHNNLKQIQAKAFSNKCNLQILFMNYDRITNIKPLGFFCLHGLRELYMENNSLTQLNDSMFVELRVLSYLSLSGNSINLVKPHSFKGLQNLLTLKLDWNQLTSLGAKTLVGLEKVKTIHLSNNKLQKIDALTFRHLTSLEELLLDNNQLQVLANEMLAGLSQITTVNLHSNRIISLREDVFSLAVNRSGEMRRPLKLSLSWNRVYCNSSVCWLKTAEKEGTIKWDQGMSPNCSNYKQRWNVDFCHYGM